MSVGERESASEVDKRRERESMCARENSVDKKGKERVCVCEREKWVGEA